MNGGRKSASQLCLSFRSRPHERSQYRTRVHIRASGMMSGSAAINYAFRMNLDAPETRLVGVPTGQLEEGRDQLEIRCLADANPPASIVWRKTKSPGVTEVASIGETLMFSPIYRNHAAVYLCEASNIEGESSPVSVQVSVNCTCARVYVCMCVCMWYRSDHLYSIRNPKFLIAKYLDDCFMIYSEQVKRAHIPGHSRCKCSAARSYRSDLRLAQPITVSVYCTWAGCTWAIWYNFSNVEHSSDVRVTQVDACRCLARDLDPAAILKLLLFQIHRRSARSDRIDWRLRCCTLVHRSNVTLMLCRRLNIGDPCQLFDITSPSSAITSAASGSLSIWLSSVRNT